MKVDTTALPTYFDFDDARVKIGGGERLVGLSFRIVIRYHGIFVAFSPVSSLETEILLGFVNRRSSSRVHNFFRFWNHVR